MSADSRRFHAGADMRHDWRDYAIIEVTQALVELAGDYADTFALRGYDSVQLAAARTLYEAGREPVQFACFDRRLPLAARVFPAGMTRETVAWLSLPGIPASRPE